MARCSGKSCQVEVLGRWRKLGLHRKGGTPGVVKFSQKFRVKLLESVSDPISRQRRWTGIFLYPKTAKIRKVHHTSSMARWQRCLPATPSRQTLVPNSSYQSCTYVSRRITLLLKIVAGISFLLVPDLRTSSHRFTLVTAILHAYPNSE